MNISQPIDMDSQIQYPVCTLYLHVGMNLQEHLNSHPKDLVISALVNMTLLQQRANDENSNSFECSRYEPLPTDDLNASSDKTLPKSITYFAPISQQTSHQLMIVNGTQVFHDQRHRRIGMASQSCSTAIRHRSGTVPPLSIPAGAIRLIPAKSNDGKIIQAIPPPPPYHTSVRNAIHRNEINQITTQIQQSCSTNVFNVSASSSSTVTTNINAINASNSSSVYVDRSPVKQTGTNEIDSDELNPSQSDEIITGDDYENQNDISCSIESDDNGREQQIEQQPSGKTGKSSESNQKQRSKHHKDAMAKDSIPADPSTSKEMRNFKQETGDATTTDIENANDKRSRGLKVLSNVQVSPNAKISMSLNSSKNDSIPLNNMIIVSSIPSTSTAFTSQQALSSSQLTKSQSLLKNLSDSRTTLDTRNSKHTKASVEIPSTSSEKHKTTEINEDDDDDD